MTSREQSVQETNDSSIVSKLSTSRSGYYTDEFLPNFVSRKGRRSPLIHRGYHIRYLVTSKVYDTFLEENGKLKNQIVSFGAGFDTTYFRLQKKGLLHNTVYIELDFFNVIRNKIDLIEKHSLLDLPTKHEHIKQQNGVVLSKDNYKLIAVDLCNLSALHEGLLAAGVDFSSPTLLMSEVSITYMPHQSCTDLIRFCCQKFSEGLFASYEQIHPNDGFGTVMINHFNKLQSPLRNIDKYPTAASQAERYKQCGWTSVHTQDMNQFYDMHVPPDEKQRVDSLEPFDEYEEWHQKCSHYVLILAGNSSKCVALLDCFISSSDHFVDCDSSKAHAVMTNVPVQKHGDATELYQVYGHAAAMIGDGVVLVCGGFGMVDGKHTRRKDIALVKIANGSEPTVVPVRVTPGDNKNYELLFATCNVVNGKVIVFGGRTSPLNPCTAILHVNVHDLQACTDDKQEVPVQLVQRQDDWPAPRWRHAACVCNINGVDKLVVCGGRTVCGEILSDVWILTPQTWKWTQLQCQGDAPPALFSHCCTSYNDSVIVSGGLTHHEQINPHLYILTVSDDDVGTWSKLHLHHGTVYPRYSHDAVLYGDNELLLFGGVSKYDLHSSPGLCRINLQHHTATEQALYGKQQPDQVYLFNKMKCFIYNSRLYSIGGGGNCFSFGTHFNDVISVLDL